MPPHHRLRLTTPRFGSPQGAALTPALALALTLAACSHDQRQPPVPPSDSVAAGAVPRKVPGSPARDAGISPRSSGPDAGTARRTVTGAQKIGQVLSCDGSCENPSLSPDGQQLSYGESPGMMKHPVFLLPAKRWRRGDSAMMSDELASGGGAHWMPDGQSMVLRAPLFQDEGAGGTPGLVIATLSGGGASLKSAQSSHDPTCPSPSPDGHRIVFERAGKKGVRELAIVEVDNVGLTVLGPGQCPEWSPDGRSILFTDKGALEALDLAGPVVGAPRVVAVGPGFIGRASFSPDGTFVVVTRQKGDASELVALHADGSDAPVVLTKRGGPFDPFWASDGFVYYALGGSAIERLEPIVTTN